MTDYDGGVCHCGGAWFRLEADPENNMPDALFCVDKRGVITGYTGQAVCDNCDSPWVPPRARLRLVETTDTPSSLPHQRQIPPLYRDI